MQAYSDPKRESDPHALPDVEVWYADGCTGRCGECPGGPDEHPDDAGWYWQACFPGCLPDGDPVGPFETEAEALADARDGMED